MNDGEWNRGEAVKRDMDLVRRILFEAEELPALDAGERLDIEGYSQEEISYHLKIMAQASLIEARASRYAGAGYWEIRGLTWRGHEFLDHARDTSRWKKALELAKEKVGVLSFEALKQILERLVANSLVAL